MVAVRDRIDGWWNLRGFAARSVATFDTAPQSVFAEAINTPTHPTGAPELHEMG
jgi:hypothetical protein